MCAVKFLRLEDFLYDRRHGQAINLEPKGILFADVCVTDMLVSWNRRCGWQISHLFEMNMIKTIA